MSAQKELLINGKSFSFPLALDLAGQLLTAGKTDAAEAIANAVLVGEAGNVDALFLQVLVAESRGRSADIERLTRQILAVSPRHAGACRALASLYCRSGLADLAIPLHETALAANPARRESWIELAETLLASGLLARAEKVATDAIASLGNDARLADCLARVAAARKEDAERAVAFVPIEQARAAGDTASMVGLLNLRLQTCPGDGIAWACLAHGLLMQGNLAGAVDAVNRASRIAPARAEVLRNMARILLRQGQTDQAMAAARRACALLPEDAENVLALSSVVAGTPDLDRAIELAARALQLAPQAAHALAHMASLLVRKGALDAAADHYRRAIEARPNFPEAMTNLANILRRQSSFDAAVGWLERALVLRPEAAEIHLSIGNIHKDLGRHQDAIERYERACAINPDSPLAWSNHLFCSHFLDGIGNDRLVALHRRFGDHFLSLAGSPAGFGASEATEDRALRIGFVSGDLYDHPVGFFLESILPPLAGRQLVLYAYANQDRRTALTERILPCFAEWRWTKNLNDEQLAAVIRQDRIDILVDLSGHTADNRLLVFARKPAPVQVTWLGYFASTGLRSMDYILGDRWVIPEGDESQFVETPFRLPDAYLCLTPPQVAVQPGAIPALSSDGRVTFGSFNNMAKLNPRVIACWSRLINAVPGSRLLLKTYQLGDPVVCERVRSWFRDAGLNDDQLVLEGPEPRAGLLAAYHRVDIGLDPFPYPGGTTTIEALWMGVPVITLCGERFLGRVGVSILSAVGLPDWVALDEDDYIARARSAAADLNGLAALRTTLRERLLQSPLCDAPRFAENLESAFRHMWKTWCER